MNSLISIFQKIELDIDFHGNIPYNNGSIHKITLLKYSLCRNVHHIDAKKANKYIFKAI